MPCYTIQMNRIDMPSMRGDLLGKALEDLGAERVSVYRDGAKLYGLHGGSSSYKGLVAVFYIDGVLYNLKNGKLLGPATSVTGVANQMKVSYSTHVVRFAAASNRLPVRTLVPFQKKAGR